MQIDDIKTLIAADLAALEATIIQQRQSPVSLAVDVTQHIMQSGGKRLRPVVLMLCARACGYEGEDHIKLAAVLEFVHTATLLHDDVVDDSTLRRGIPTANQQFGNLASVLVGDFLYSRAFQLMVQVENFAILSVLANATNTIAEGEILQLMNRHNPHITTSTYLQIIQHKTGKLFEVAAHLAGLLAKLSTQECKQLQTYGMNLGTAFQLIDDMLDYEADATEMGKNLGDDLAQGSPTLPLIYALEHGNNEQAELIRQSIEQGGLGNLENIKVAIESTAALTYTANQAAQQGEKALQGLNFLPASPYKTALEHLVSFALSRRY